MLGFAFSQAHQSQEIALKLRKSQEKQERKQRQQQSQSDAPNANADAGVAPASPGGRQQALAGPPVTSSRVTGISLFRTQKTSSSVSSISSTSATSSNEAAQADCEGGTTRGRRRSRRRRRTKKNGGGGGSGGSSGATVNSSIIPGAVATAPNSSCVSPSSKTSTSSSPKKPHDAPMTKRDLYFCLRCGMVGIGPDAVDSAVGRVTVVNWENDIVFDTFVKVPVPVTDYRTQRTEITEQHLLVGQPLDVVRKKVASLLKGKILIGHGLEVDLAALGLSHPFCDVRDVATYPPYMKNIVDALTVMVLPRDLDDLLYHFLGRQLTSPDPAHPLNQYQHEDQYRQPKLVMEAVGCLDLYKIKRREWEAELILLLRQKQRQREVMLDMRNSGGGTQLTSITEDALDTSAGPAAHYGILQQNELLQQQLHREGGGNGLPHSLSSSMSFASSTVASTMTGNTTTTDNIYARRIGGSSVSTDGAVSLGSAANEDDVSAASAASSYYYDIRGGQATEGTPNSHPPRFVYEQGRVPTRGASSTAVDARTPWTSSMSNLETADGWSPSEHGSEVGVPVGGGGATSSENIWSPFVPESSSHLEHPATDSTIGSSHVTTGATGPINPACATPDWSIGSTQSNRPSNRIPPGFSSPWQEHQHRQEQSPSNNATSEDEVMENLVSNLLNLDCDDDLTESILSANHRSVTNDGSIPELQTTTQHSDHLAYRRQQQEQVPIRDKQAGWSHDVSNTSGDAGDSGAGYSDWRLYEQEQQQQQKQRKQSLPLNGSDNHTHQQSSLGDDAAWVDI